MDSIHFKLTTKTEHGTEIGILRGLIGDLICESTGMSQKEFAKRLRKAFPKKEGFVLITSISVEDKITNI